MLEAALWGFVAGSARKDSTMASLMELVDRVNKGEMIDPELLEVYQESPNSAEKFLAHHAHAMLDLRRAHQHILQSLEAIDYSDQKVLNQFISVSSFLGLTAPAPVFYLVRTAFDGEDRPVEICEHVMSGERWQLSYEWQAD